MQDETRELHRTEAGEVWRLVFDRTRGTLHVEHEWPEPANPAPGQPIHASRSLCFGEFFETGPAPVVAEVKRLLEPIFPDPHPPG